ncbi:MAG TPA: POTRA domain-containing protein [Vicinamibacterales bacterium]|nr:POTRA domain-containing protein [Vicinamibacterales bacterium]
MRPPPPARAFALAAALAAWTASPSAAQDAGLPVGRTISDVSVVSEGRPVLDAQVLELLALRKGSPLRMEDARATIVRAMGLGRYLDVRVSAEPDGDAVRLSVDLVPLPAQGRLVFEGDLGLSESAIRGAVTERFGPDPPRGRADEVARVVGDLLRDQGYLRATVTPRDARPGETGFGDLVFNVVCGPRALVRSISFRPEAGEEVEQLRLRLSIRPGVVFNRVELRRQLDAATEAWRSRGYLEARIDALVEELSEGRGVAVSIDVHRGRRVSVEFEGDPLPPPQLAELVPIQREASVDEDLLEDSRARIVSYLRGRGYRDARAEFRRVVEDSRLRIVFTVANGPLYRVAGIVIDGASQVPLKELTPLLRLSPGQAYIQAVVDGDLAALTAAYRRRGFGEASCKAAIEPVPNARTAHEAPVLVTIRIAEGARTLVGSVGVSGNEAVADADLLAGLSTRPGQPFYAPNTEADRDRILLRYLNLGYRLARVEASVEHDPDTGRASVVFPVREGPQILVGHILVVGNARIGMDTIRRELAVEPGRPLALDAVNESQRRLASLGLFRRVTISEIQQRDDHVRDVVVTVEEAPATTLGYGVGLEAQKVETSEIAPRGFVEIGRRNLFGGNRSINLFGRVSLRRRTAEGAATGGQPVDGGSETAAEYRVAATYREPRLWRSLDFQIIAGAERGRRTSFSFEHQSARFNLSRRLDAAWSVQGQYSLQENRIYHDRIAPADRPLIDRLFPQVRIASVSASAVRNTRDDVFDPGRGTFLGLNGELALRELGSEVGFAKTFLQGFIYRRLPTSRRIVLAGGLRLGLGVGFPREVRLTDEHGEPVIGDDGGPQIVRVSDLPASERFFAGGDTTVRGYRLDHVGRPDTLDSDGTPKGGRAGLILNGEVRVGLWRDLGVVGFIDAGNAFRVVDDVTLRHLRSGAGFGIRYKSPIGPFRLDLGFKLGKLRKFVGTREGRRAVHISIGQAF